LPVLFSNLSVVTGHLKSGALARARGHLAAARARPFPICRPSPSRDLPGFEVETWFGLTAAAATPREIVQRLNAEVLKALASPDLQKRFADLSLTVSPVTPGAARCDHQVGSHPVGRRDSPRRHSCCGVRT
jgi:tripartite-type tricarboxylate transporter receptor subunit TctC